MAAIGFPGDPRKGPLRRLCQNSVEERPTKRPARGASFLKSLPQAAFSRPISVAGPSRLMSRFRLKAITAMAISHWVPLRPRSRKRRPKCRSLSSAKGRSTVQRRSRMASGVARSCILRNTASSQWRVTILRRAVVQDAFKEHAPQTDASAA